MAGLIAQLPIEHRILEAADVFYDGTADDAGSDSCFNWITLKNMFITGEGHERHEQLAQFIPSSFRSSWSTISKALRPPADAARPPSSTAAKRAVVVEGTLGWQLARHGEEDGQGDDGPRVGHDEPEGGALCSNLHLQVGSHGPVAQQLPPKELVAGRPGGCAHGAKRQTRASVLSKRLRNYQYPRNTDLPSQIAKTDAKGFKIFADTLEVIEVIEEPALPVVTARMTPIEKLPRVRAHARADEAEIRIIAELGVWRGFGAPEPWRQPPAAQRFRGGAGRRVGAHTVRGAERGAASTSSTRSSPLSACRRQCPLASLSGETSCPAPVCSL